MIPRATVIQPRSKRPSPLLLCSELQAAWADIGSGGRAQRAEVVELLPEERADLLTVEMHDGQGTLATGSISIATLWEARTMATLTTSKVYA